MTDYDLQLVQLQLRELREEIEAIKRALARTRISTGHTGNQWFTIPPAPQKGEEDGSEASKHSGVLEVTGRDADSA